MGGAKKKAVVPIKKESKYKIPARFDCPLCDAKNSIAVRLFRNTGSAKLHCRSCRAGAGKEYPLLSLEKPVDIFFRFREELMQQDREFLNEHNIETNAVTATTKATTGLGQLLQRVATTKPIATAEAGDAATRGDVGGMHRIEFGDEDAEDNGSHFFAMAERSSEYGEGEGIDF